MENESQQKKQILSRRTQWLKGSSIREISHLAASFNAINLAEGFPDFPASAEVKDTAISLPFKLTSISTGWRIGWALARQDVISAIKNIHVNLTDTAPAPFQEAAVTALKGTPEYSWNLKREYGERRDIILNVLEKIGFKIHIKPQGSIFVFAELPETIQLDDVEYVTRLIKIAGVAAVPGCSGFFNAEKSSIYGSADSVDAPVDFTERNYTSRYIRFCYNLYSLAGHFEGGCLRWKNI